MTQAELARDHRLHVAEERGDLGAAFEMRADRRKAALHAVVQELLHERAELDVGFVLHLGERRLRTLRPSARSRGALRRSPQRPLPTPRYLHLVVAAHELEPDVRRAAAL